MRLDDIRIFVQTVNSGSFSEAARHLNIDPKLASTAVLRLEKSLGARLLIRSTRSMQLSEAGKRYLPHARNVLIALEDGHRSIGAVTDAVSGPLRLSAPSDFGRNLLLPWLDAFQRQHRDVSIHLRVSDRAADLLRLPLDAAIRYGPLGDSSLIALPLVEDNRRALCASPSYLIQHGCPKCVEDLRLHNCLRYVWGDQIHERWLFTLPEGDRTITVRGNRVSDDADAVRRWAVAGEGLIYKSRLDLIPDIVEGRLMEIFPHAHCEPSLLNLVCADRARLTPAIVQLVEFLRTCCAQLLSTMHPEHLPGTLHVDRSAFN